jgi:hypothetical protein
MRYSIMRLEPGPLDVSHVAETVVSIFLKGMEERH